MTALPGQDLSDPKLSHVVVATRGLSKSFDDGHSGVCAVQDVDLDVYEDEVLALLGPSGCGKTTMLRLLAGFEDPDTGRILLDGQEVASTESSVPPEKRRVGVVFQDYALFPHLSVAANVAYGIRKDPNKSVRVNEILELVGLTSQAGRLPHELSGGQQQRVALGRALAPNPTIVLLDEPFSNLDAALRDRVRSEVREILSAARATAVMVTHDRDEALGMADRVAVMSEGRVLQIGSPADLYAHPSSKFVATFVGEADVLAGDASDGRVTTALGNLALAEGSPSGPVDVVLRPEAVRIHLDGEGAATVGHTHYFGHDQLVEVHLADGLKLRARTAAGTRFSEGDRVAVSVAGAVLAFARAS